MTDILILKNQISSATEALLTHIKRICDTQEVPFFIAGATAREILLHNVHGRTTGRHTRDVDIAVFINDWSVFESLKKAFIAEGARDLRDNIHRMIVNGIELDIIPFGGVAENNEVAWPPERKIIMSVDGFYEVFSNTVTVRLDNSENILFCSLPGLALLKLFAWRDRGVSSTKDAVDIYKIIQEYSNVEDERIYSDIVDGDKLEWDLVRMGAFLLGHDIVEISEASSLEELLRLDIERLTDAIARKSDEDDMSKVELVMNDFWSGVLSETTA